MFKNSSAEHCGIQFLKTKGHRFHSTFLAEIVITDLKITVFTEKIDGLKKKKRKKFTKALQQTSFVFVFSVK